jgi:hypothetical protein
MVSDLDESYRCLLSFDPICHKANRGNEFPMKGLRGAGEVRHVARNPLA